MPAQTLVVGIAGPSGCGKSVLADTVVARSRRRAAALPIDAYYRDLSQLPPAARAATNFDCPEAFDHALLFAQVRALSNGRSVHRPVYDFATHTRASATVAVGPVDLLVVEGVFALYWPVLLARYRLRVFLAAPDEVCLQRRLLRDAGQRARTPAAVRRQYATHVRPMYLRYVEPTRSLADLVLDGTAPAAANAERIEQALACPPPRTGAAGE